MAVLLTRSAMTHDSFDEIWIIIQSCKSLGEQVAPTDCRESDPGVAKAEMLFYKRK